MTFVPGFSEPIKEIFKQDIPNLTVAPKPFFKISSFFAKRKDRINLEDQSGMVYKINCLQCEKCYIGETTQKLSTRINQHKNNVRNGATMKNPTALVKHGVTANHLFDFQNVQSLCQERNKRKLQLQEINQIIIHRETACNFKTDSDEVSPLYYNLVKFSNNLSNLPSHEEDVSPT